MPRSASDATRFTATGPYVAAKPTGSQLQFGAAAPANETPQEKIARLRAAAQQARAGQESQFDKVVLVGRRWADRAHRVTTWSLIGLTVFCFVGASFATGDMIMHNRRKRGEWLAEQQAKSARELEEARKAIATGVATPQQVLLLNRERAAMEAEEVRKSAKGIFTRMKETLFFSMSEEEEQGGKIGAAARAAQEKAQEVKQEVMPESSQGSGVVKAVEQKVQELKRSGTEAVEGVARSTAFGGPLDRQAQASVDAVRNQTSSWFSWVTGR